MISVRFKFGLMTAGLVVVMLLGFNTSIAQIGKDGVRTITTVNTVVNEYTFLTQDVVVGDTILNVSSSSLNAGGTFSSPLTPGDLLMVIQLQGATINTADDSTYGDIIMYNNCGFHELALVSSIPSSTSIVVSCNLQHDYTASGHVQVIRVPRYSQLIVNNGASIGCPSWNGSTGGVIAIECDSNLLINSGGAIDASLRGFRGGVISENLSTYGVLNYRSSLGDYGAPKGEGIAGSVIEYDSLFGRFGKGAPANGGGGGNGHNCGGGGGANGGDPFQWTGKGIPDLTVSNYTQAWNLEATGFASSQSTGGGKGGYSFSSTNQDALIVGNFNSLWGGDWRRDNGGRGGRPLQYSDDRLFMGGGGGAGDQNDNRGGNGGNGGGLIYILSRGTISGSGTINANGGNGINSTASTSGNDAAGGGGGGGTVVLSAKGLISGISINANGGRGGNQNVILLRLDAYGPGGGGGGGYIAAGNGALVRNALGGANGVTNSSSLTEFPPNGATKGAAGFSFDSTTVFDISVHGDTVCYGSEDTLSVFVNGTLPAGTVFQWYAYPNATVPIATGNTIITAPIYNDTIFYVGTCPGYLRRPVSIKVDAVSAAFQSPAPVCEGSTIALTGTGQSSLGGSLSSTWNFGDGSPAANGFSVVHTYPTAGNYPITLTVTDSIGCSTSVINQLSVVAGPAINFVAANRFGCGSVTTSFTVNNLPSAICHWEFGDGTTGNGNFPTHNYTAPGSYGVLFYVTTAACTSYLYRPDYIVVRPYPTASFSVPQQVCNPDSVSFLNTSAAAGSGTLSYSWTFGDSTMGSSQISPSHSYATAGTYSATLLVTETDSAGRTCQSASVASIQVADKTNAAITTTGISGCSPFLTSFSAGTNPSAATYSWSFGDGTFATASAPSHVFSSVDTFTVSLVVTNGFCSDTSAVLITVAASGSATFSAPSNVCSGDTVLFSNTSTGLPAVYRWDFGDTTTISGVTNPTHVYFTPGVYQAQLILNPGSSCADTATQTITIASAPVITFSTLNTTGCDTVFAAFNNTSTGGNNYHWDFGDGTTSTQFFGSHAYTAPGIYDVTLSSISPGGCPASLTRAGYISVYASPVPSFTSSQTIFCSNTCISFSGSATNNPSSWSWQFTGATPTNSTSQSPASICYQLPGQYGVSLTVSDAHCSKTLSRTNFVTVTDCSIPPVADFYSTDTTFCINGCVTFVSTASNALLWNWSFPGGVPSSSTSQVPGSVCYPTAGDYPVTLVVQNPAGSDSLRAVNFIHVGSLPPIPSFTQSGDTLYAPQGYFNYQWYRNGLLISGVNASFYPAPQSGSYAVAVTNSFGCRAVSQPRNVSLIGVDDILLEEGIEVFPNPMTDRLFIRLLDKRITKLNFTIYDALGRRTNVFLLDSATSGFYDIDMALLPAGVYYFEFVNAKGVSVRKWVKS